MAKLLDLISYKHIYILLAIALCIEFVLLNDLPFFWDAISKSERAQWIFENKISEFILPTRINSGHPPLWTSLLALFWTIFGKTLLTSRLLLLIVNFGVFYQIIALCKMFLPKTISVIVVLIIFFEPTLVAQTTSLNNDMLLLFFTLLSIRALINGKTFYFFIALTGLLLTNLRGMYLVMVIIVLHFIYSKFKFLKFNKRYLFSYAAAIILFILYCFWHYKKLGWAIVTTNESYSLHRQTVDSDGVLINAMVFGKSFLEFGRFMIFIFLIPLIIKYLRRFKNNLLINKNVIMVFIALGIYLLVLFVGMVPFSNPIAGRYFMICYILAILLLIMLIHHIDIKWKRTIYIGLILAFVSGHFWIYKPTFSQSWDSTLAYLNYYKVEDQMEQFIDFQNLNRHDIGTRIRLNERSSAELKSYSRDLYYASFDLESNRYIILSNIENYTKDEEYLEVSNQWKHLKTVSQMGVFISLYKKP